MIPLPCWCLKNVRGSSFIDGGRDFGITAAVVAVTATVATVAGVAISQTAVAAETVLSGEVGGALRMRSALDSHI